MAPSRLIPTALACLLPLVAGCLNASDSLTGVEHDALPDLGPEATPQAVDSKGPSVRGLDRRNWPVTVVAAPRGQVEHQPTYAEPFVMNGGDARNGETFPTVADAMQRGTPLDRAAAEGAVESVWPAVLMIASPARMVLGMPPWLTMQGPRQPQGVLPPAQARECAGMWVWVSAPAPEEP
jgi:hypothetical protein